MNRILATFATGLLLAWAISVPVACAADETTAALQGTKPDSTAKTEDHAKGESATGPATKAADEHAAAVAEPGSGSKEGDHSPAEHAAGAGHAHAHDPHDLSHGDGSAQLKAAQELRFDLAIATLIIFLLLLAILAKFAWGPITEGLEKREQTIAQQIAEAKAASDTARKQLQEYERKLAAATEEARAIVTQARQDAVAAKDKIVAEAQAAAAKERDRAVADISSAKNQALREIAEQSVNTAISLASNIIRREVKPEDHDKLISDSLQKFSHLN